MPFFFTNKNSDPVVWEIERYKTIFIGFAECKIKTTCTTWPMNQKERSKLFHEKAEVEKGNVW